MKSPAKCLLGVAIGIVALAIAILIARLTADDEWWPLFPAAVVICIAYWFGGRMIAEGWQTSTAGLGERLLDQLTYPTDSRDSWYAMWFWFFVFVAKAAFKHRGLPPLNELLPWVFVVMPVWVFFSFANPWRRLNIPLAGYAIHEHGIYTVSRSIRFEDIVSIDCPESPSQGFRIKLRHSIHAFQNTETVAEDFEEVRQLLRAKGVLNEELDVAS